MNFLYDILENPCVHDICQEIMTLGRRKALRFTEKFILNNSRGRVLDFGCGTARYSHLFPRDYTGLDINVHYIKQKTVQGKTFVCADSRQMPFKDKFFDTIFSVGVFHHIGSDAAEDIFKEILRVAKPNARILIVDFFYPEVELDLPGWLVSKLDRGKFVRMRTVFMRQLTYFFDIVSTDPVQGSYPYNLHAIILKQKSFR